MAEKYTLDDLQDLSTEELAELVIQNQENYSKLQSSTTKWAQDLLEEKKSLEKAMSMVVKDKESLAWLYETDPELAKKVSKKLFWDEEIPTTQKKTEDIQTIVNRAMFQRTIDDKIGNVSSQLWGDAKEQFEKDFAELTEWREITKDNLDKFIKAALSLVSVDVDGEQVDLARTISMGSSSTTKTKSASAKATEARIAYAKKMAG